MKQMWKKETILMIDFENVEKEQGAADDNDLEDTLGKAVQMK